MSRYEASVRHLRDYVAIPSVNPMGRSDIPDNIVGEHRYAEHVCEQLRRIGLDAVTIGSEKRPSVVAEAVPSKPIDTVLVASHLDTVPVDGMEIDPFDPRVEAGRLYGRGSCDTKGGMAALMAALEEVLARGTLRRGCIVVGEADEELGSIGVYDVLGHLGGRRPDWVLATEPTELRIVNQHKGIAIARLRAKGRACHSSDPAAGRNAIVSLSRAVLALDALGERLSEHKNTRLGPATLSVGVVGGGQAPNIVPDDAWLVMDRRIVPGETEDGIRAEIEAAIANAAIEDVVVETCRVEKGALGTPDDHPAVQKCRSALVHEGIADSLGSVAFGTDAGVFANVGLPGVVMGPGSIERAHTAREYVEIDQLEAMTGFFIALLEGR